MPIFHLLSLTLFNEDEDNTFYMIMHNTVEY